VWVRLPSVPLEYFDAAILTIIGNRIGKTVRLDLTTLGGSRGNLHSFALKSICQNLSSPSIDCEGESGVSSTRVFTLSAIQMVALVMCRSTVKTKLRRSLLLCREK
ncbi:hypothetical protein LINPERHAP2_LOCUS16682, partial [Linum perenne]